MADTLNNIVKANARPFPLMGDTSEETRAETLFSDRDSQLEIDALTPYVDLARMARERYDNNPSIQNGARMSEKVGVLKTRLTNILKAIPMRESELWELVRQKFPNIAWICFGEDKEAGND